MKKGSFLLRFVDVVLILLFGFIVISDLDEDTQILLPESYETERMSAGPDQNLYISITAEGEFLHEAENLQFDDLGNLENYIISKSNMWGDDLKVRIRANHDAHVKHAVAVAQMCDRNNIRKAIDVKILMR